MRFSIRIFIIFILAPLFFVPQTVHGDKRDRKRPRLSIKVTGNWSETIDKNDLLYGAGSDLQSTYTSASGQVLIDIRGARRNDAWRIDIRKLDNNWNDNLHPYVMRTSDGRGGSVSGGTSSQEVTDINTPFFSGSGRVRGINVQLRLTGASIQISPSSYSTVLYYTVVDIQ